jgi:hypothetical protein
VVGGEKVYTCKEFFLATSKMHCLNVGRKIVQFYIQSVDGSYVKPIGHFVISYDKPSTWIENKLQMLVSMYEVDRVQIVGSASDSDLFTVDSLELMNKWMETRSWF